MGKEIGGAYRCVQHPPARRRFIENVNLLQELAHQWLTVNGIASQKELAEDGHVVVTISTRAEDTTLLCTGFANARNKYTDLVKLLRKKGKIPKRGKIESYLVGEGFAMTAVDPAKERFTSGDQVTLVLRDVRPRASRVPKPILNRKPRSRRALAKPS